MPPDTRTDLLTGGSSVRIIPRFLVGLLGVLIALAVRPWSAQAQAQAQAQALEMVPLLSAPDSASLARLAALRPAAPAQPPFGPAADTVDVRGRNYWAEGAAIGAVALGVPVAILGFGLCEEDCGSSILLTSLGSAAAGAFIGAMIGGSVDKQPKESTAPR